MATFSLTQTITSLGAAAALVTAIFVIDARYTKNTDLIAVKTEIISELRNEVTRNRSVMIDTMQREADDLEFQITQLHDAGETVPRYLIEKHKQIERAIGRLENEEDSD